MRAPRTAALAALTLLALGSCQDEAPDAPAPAEPPAVPTFTGEFTRVDDGAEDPDFAAFRDDLRDVVARRDTAALLALVAPDARLSFGDTPGGPEGFRAMWFRGAPPDARGVWDVLAHALEGGSVDEDGAITVPFLIGLWPSDADPFAHVAVLDASVAAYDQPGGSEIARLGQIIVPALAPPLDGWLQVRLPDARTGYVPDSSTYSPVGYRAVFWDDGDGWRLRSLLAGD